MSLSPIRDSIPRVQHIRYFQAALEGVADGLTFDGIRSTLRRVARETGGRITASRVDDAFTLWSPTADALSELMRLELIEHRPIPSKRTAVDSHRDTTYCLTTSGRSIVEEVKGNDSKFRA